MPPKKGKKKNRQASQPGQTSQAGQAVPPPRAGKYGKLIARFYEPLVLLHALGRVRGDMIPIRHEDTRKRNKRQFQDDLAFLCEYDKGGDSCTAIGLQDCPDKIVYWTAANVNPANKIVPFLKLVLEDLNTASRLPADERAALQQRFIDRYLEYATPKLKKQRNFLRINMDKCRGSLPADSEDTADRELAIWFDRLDSDSDDPPLLCRTACEFRASGYMRRLKELGQHETSPFDGCFTGARHYIGRFADSIRVPRRLFRRLPCLEDIVQSPFTVEVIEPPRCIPPPQADRFTTIEGICRRMFPSNDPDVELLTANLLQMDRDMHVLDRIQTEYARSTFKPRVHAEVQVLEHFYHHRDAMQWFQDDAYIGCSKPACFCCRLYFLHHPAQPVVPSSHQKLFLNWGLAHLPEGVDHPQFRHQRDVLNKMLPDIRKDAVRQIQEVGGRRSDRADSRTGITRDSDNNSLEGNVSENENSGNENSGNENSGNENSENENSISEISENSERNVSHATFDPPSDVTASPASSWSSSADGGGLAKQFTREEEEDDDDSDGGAVV